MANNNTTKRRPGRPSTVGADTRIPLRAPRSLAADMGAAAAAEGISESEAWRRAAEAWLTARHWEKVESDTGQPQP